MSDDSDDDEPRERTAFEHLVDAARCAAIAAVWRGITRGTGGGWAADSLRQSADAEARRLGRLATVSACAAALVLVADLASLGGSAVEREAHADDLDEPDPAAGASERASVVGVDVRAGTADHDLDAGGHPPDGSAVPSPARGERVEA